jgi:hypothetical protein
MIEIVFRCASNSNPKTLLDSRSLILVDLAMILAKNPIFRRDSRMLGEPQMNVAAGSARHCGRYLADDRL